MRNQTRRVTILALVVLFFFLLIAPMAHAAPSTWISRRNTSERVVALTIDDGSDGANYAKILEILDKHNVKATFFLTGAGANAHPQMVRNTVAKGHDIGNHSYNHPDFTKISTNEMRNQLTRTETTIRNITGRSTKPYFRAPYGSTNSTVLRTVGDAGYSYTFHWTIDTLDWTGNSATTIYNRVMNGLQPGAIILMHTGRGASGTPAALDRFIPAIKSRGYRFVTISQLMNRPAPPATSTTYTVRAGDTLYSIARRYNTTVTSIAQENNIRNVNLIRVGQRLTIPGRAVSVPQPPPAPAPRTYTVKRGDTLYSIARRYNTTVSRLAQVNNIRNVNLIRVGQRLVIR
jgi:peptidoglycan/xylan/chitin deacetylase (PgdA/CDA1 family)